MPNYKIGVIGLPGKWSTEVLADEVEKQTGFRQVIDMALVSLDLAEGRLWFGDDDLSTYDALIIKKITRQYCPNTLDRLELLKFAQAKGVQVFSRPDNIQQLINRLGCTVKMANAGLPMPETVITEDLDMALDTVMRFQSAILKPLFSTKAQGMQQVNSGMKKSHIIRELKKLQADHPSLYIQKTIEFGGRDLGLMFLNNKYLGAYARVGHKDTWNTTIHSGGHYAPATPEQNVIDLAFKAQQLFDMDYTTVDVALTDDGPKIFEVSAFGGFRGAHEAMNMNVAERYVQYILQRLQSGSLCTNTQLTIA